MNANPHAVADSSSGVSLYQVGPEGWPMVDGKPCADCVEIGEIKEPFVDGGGFGEAYIVRKGECAVHEASRVAWLTDMRQCHGPGIDAVRQIAGEWSTRCAVATVGNGAYCHAHDTQMARLQTVGLDGIKVKDPEVLRPLRPRKTEEEALAVHIAYVEARGYVVTQPNRKE